MRVINRAPGLKLVVQTLLSSLRPIGNIVLICCTFFVIFGILGVQLFKGAFYYCEGPDIKSVRNKTDCLADKRNVWLNRKYNFDDLGKALMSLFVLSSRDGWVNIMYTGLDAVGVDQQVTRSSEPILFPTLRCSFRSIRYLQVGLLAKFLRSDHLLWEPRTVTSDRIRRFLLHWSLDNLLFALPRVVLKYT